MTTLVLGTAQWGHEYGVTNKRGRLSDTDLSEIVEEAKAQRIDKIDTARSYGYAESRLRKFAQNFTITTKVAGSIDIASQIQASMANLGVSDIDTLLIHDWHKLNAQQQTDAARGLGEAIEVGSVVRVGVSIYEESEIMSAADVFASQDIVLGALQVPANAIDRRLDESAALGDLRSAGAHITVRSAFLQGVLLADSGRWSDHPDVRAFHEASAKIGALRSCLGHVRGLSWATHVVIGVTNAHELAAACHAWDSTEPELLPEELASSDRKLLDPRLW